MEVMGKTEKLFFTDWEGPWITTDFAYEISKRILNNKAFFERLSQYDDYLYFVERKAGYNAGDTLRLLAPFIAAYGVSSSQLEQLAEETAFFVPDAEEAMRILQKKFRPVVISTSYVQYLEATARKIGINGHLHGTEFDVDELSSLFNEKDRAEAEKLIKKIAEMPEIKVDVEKRELVSGYEAVSFLNRIFWSLESQESRENASEFRQKVQEVSEKIMVIGGKRKLEVVKKYGPSEPLAIGDSISDYEMLGWVKEKGLAISFNGNEYSLMQSNLAIVSDSAFSEAAVVEAFLLHGLDGVKKLANLVNSKKWNELEFVDGKIVGGLEKSRTRLYWINGENFRKILKESMEMRKALRGDAGKLG
ncbi:MAG: hypothetical protein H0Z28_05450 [Archaeoglobus sp.]|nr:hypothetical protein [Archaeoglobus sp.]